MTTQEIEPRVLEKAFEQARILSARVREAYTKGQIRTFKDIETFGIELANFTEEAKLKPIVTGLQVDAIRNAYVTNTPSRLAAAFASAPGRKKLRLAPSEDVCYQFRHSSYRLYREQDPVFRSVVESQYGPENARVALVPAGTGAGKTIIGAAILDWIIANNKHVPALPLPLPYPIQWYTVKNAVPQTLEKLDACGLGDQLGKIIHVWPYSAMTSTFGLERLFEEVLTTDPFTGEERIEYILRPMAVGSYYIFDECHALARETSNRTKAVFSLDERIRSFPFLNTKYLFMTATLAERVNDTRVIVSFADIKFQGTPITKSSFSTAFANIIGGQAGPAVPSKASISRLFDAIAPIIHEPPYFPWPFKAINAIRPVTFADASDREYYDTAFERYLDRIENLGKDTPSDLAARRIALGQLRKAAEPCRAKQMVDDAVLGLNNGKSQLIGTAYTGTIIKAVFYLQDHYGYTRDDFSVIWGGRGDPKPEKVFTQEELLNLLMHPDPSPKTLKLLQKNLDWQEDRLLFGDASADAQDSRHQRLKDLGLLGVQSYEKRQAEINKFKSGRAKFCFFTLQSGGTGLSLEHCDDSCLPREGRYPVIYNGKEWVQALGRAHRRNSISDTYQYIYILLDTIEFEHVGPVLDRKLQCLGEATTKKDDLFSLLINLSAAELRAKQSATIRSLAEAEAQCRADENTQLHAGDTDNDDDEDDE